MEVPVLYSTQSASSNRSPTREKIKLEAPVLYSTYSSTSDQRSVKSLFSLIDRKLEQVRGPHAIFQPRRPPSALSSNVLIPQRSPFRDSNSPSQAAVPLTSSVTSLSQPLPRNSSLPDRRSSRWRGKLPRHYGGQQRQIVPPILRSASETPSLHKAPSPHTSVIWFQNFGYKSRMAETKVGTPPSASAPKRTPKKDKSTQTMEVSAPDANEQTWTRAPGSPAERPPGCSHGLCPKCQLPQLLRKCLTAKSSDSSISTPRSAWQFWRHARSVRNRLGGCSSDSSSERSVGRARGLALKLWRVCFDKARVRRRRRWGEYAKENGNFVMRMLRKERPEPNVVRRTSSEERARAELMSKPIVYVHELFLR